MSPEELRAREEAAFGDFLRGLGQPGDSGDLAPFEHNLEVRGAGGSEGGLGTLGTGRGTWEGAKGHWGCGTGALGDIGVTGDREGDTGRWEGG